MSATSDVNEIYLSTSPHIANSNTTQKIMCTVAVSLLPLCIFGVVLFGINALLTLLVTSASSVVFEFLFRKLTKQPVRANDCSALVSGMMLGLVLPPGLPLWMPMLASLVSIVVAKEFFGGLGANVFNPALTGRAFLFISFSKLMGTWEAPAFAVDAVSSATPLALGAGSVSVADLFFGTTGGCIGETSSLLILIAFVFLACTKIIDWRTPVTMVLTAVIYGWVFAGDSGLCSGNILFELMSGGLLFGAVFMATDYATTPVTKKGRIIFGFGCGLITGLIRQFSGYPEGVMFSILIMNALVPFLNRLTGRIYGTSKRGTAK
ncbi:MAG: RnfABCDGE type electron transport complex subunit D [Treponemataceae bacterium]|nr:RnfABCDGE type electron transport complex subunit D [Treponemataceae bacterium]